jgi:hypothetical protein
MTAHHYSRMCQHMLGYHCKVHSHTHYAEVQECYCGRLPRMRQKQKQLQQGPPPFGVTFHMCYSKGLSMTQRCHTNNCDVMLHGLCCRLPCDRSNMDPQESNAAVLVDGAVLIASQYTIASSINGTS